MKLIFLKPAPKSRSVFYSLTLLPVVLLRLSPIIYRITYSFHRITNWKNCTRQNRHGSLTCTCPPMSDDFNVLISSYLRIWLTSCHMIHVASISYVKPVNYIRRNMSIAHRLHFNLTVKRLVQNKKVSQKWQWTIAIHLNRTIYFNRVWYF